MGSQRTHPTAQSHEAQELQKPQAHPEGDGAQRQLQVWVRGQTGPLADSTMTLVYGGLQRVPWASLTGGSRQPGTSWVGRLGTGRQSRGSREGCFLSWSHLE